MKIHIEEIGPLVDIRRFSDSKTTYSLNELFTTP